ncbi:hypothetical protein [Alkalimarinus sediminis]|uniref:Uncharacterized protein n=1 Tax=Alkalimarinus sediminis TaxID=1632866 RepID=A0A9E8HI64_9ALTE|nr:hypothetical protein [Alkalimarinus sediminis]UZW74642.1 hypothetical protein NNL22_16725 [Alkalimarinus sediminis]
MGKVIDFRIPDQQDASEIKEALCERLYKTGLNDEFVEYTWPHCEALIKRFASKPGVDKEVVMELLHLRINLDLEHFSRMH